MVALPRLLKKLDLFAVRPRDEARAGEYSAVREAEIVKINVPEGWKQLKEGIVVCTEESDWWDEDMWWAENDRWVIDVGTRGGDRIYYCVLVPKKPVREHEHYDEQWCREHLSLEPDDVIPEWENERELTELETADEVVAWIYAWFEKISAEDA